MMMMMIDGIMTYNHVHSELNYQIYNEPNYAVTSQTNRQSTEDNDQ